jgi:CRISPR-associated protein Cas4
MIAVSALPTYTYCPRKFYLQYVLDIKPIEVDRIVKGEIKHNVFDQINRIEEQIVKRIAPENLKEVGMMYKQEYYRALMNTIDQKESTILKVGIDKKELLEETWKRLMQEAELRAKNIIDFAEQCNMYGKDLWEHLTPKYITELSVMSTNLKLRGRIDRVEVEEEKYTPVELKTGRMPINGMWPGDKMQLGAYILLLKQKYKSEHGYLEYTEYGVRKKLEMDNKLQEEIINLTEEVHDTIKSRYLPKRCDERRCTNCNMKENCETIKEDYAHDEEQEP